MAPVYDKPMIYYPLSTLMLAGIREVLVISSPRDIGGFEKLLGDGVKWGMKISYITQPKPEGLAQAFVLGADFIADDHVALVLGDNIFYGRGFQGILGSACLLETGATIFGYEVRDPERYGVVEFDGQKIKNIVEKPKKPASNYVNTGLWMFSPEVFGLLKDLKK